MSTAEERKRRKRQKEMMAMQKNTESSGSSGVGNNGDEILDVAPALSNDAGCPDLWQGPCPSWSICLFSPGLCGSCCGL